MKNVFEYLVNPFKKTAGLTALIAGFVAMTLTSVLAWLTGTRFDGVIDIHIGPSLSYLVYLVDLVIGYVSLVLFLYPMGALLSSSKIRLIDVAGTIALSRAPLIIAPVISTFSQAKTMTAYFLSFLTQETPNQSPTTTQFFLFGLSLFLTIALTVYIIMLMYRAYALSANLKGNKAVISFIGSLVLAEALSKVLLYFIEVKQF